MDLFFQIYVIFPLNFQWSFLSSYIVYILTEYTLTYMELNLLFTSCLYLSDSETTKLLEAHGETW